MLDAEPVWLRELNAPTSLAELELGDPDREREWERGLRAEPPRRGRGGDGARPGRAAAAGLDQGGLMAPRAEGPATRRRTSWCRSARAPACRRSPAMQLARPAQGGGAAGDAGAETGGRGLQPPQRGRDRGALAGDGEDRRDPLRPGRSGAAGGRRELARLHLDRRGRRRLRPRRAGAGAGAGEARRRSPAGSRR